jgi:23S rRNA (adenine2503-C2)-methyltransferase
MLDLTVPHEVDVQPAALADVLQAAGEPPFRLRQVLAWKYRKLADGYADMHNISLALRQRLAREAPFTRLRLVDEAWSTDALTTKLLFALQDGQTIESVLMRQHGAHEAAARNTVCVSSQAGCKMACSFCATGHGGWRRNLEPDEIADQVLHFARLLKDEDAHVTNVVFMGMGEPLDNYDNVLTGIALLNGPFGLGARSITVSTCGLVPQIRRLADERTQVNLAVSLAATTDERRNDLIPVNRRWPIAELLEACDAYARRTHRRVTFEYVLIAGVNDGLDEAERLATLMAGRLAHVNLIPLNPVEGDGYLRPSENSIRRFEDVLRVQNVPVSVRYSKGTDIVAGCGQLRARSLSA